VPIAAELRQALYNTAPWRELSRRLRSERALDRCECEGQCGKHHQDRPGARCPEVDGKPAIEQKGTVRLSACHWYQSESGQMVAEDRLIVFCTACHLRWDQESHLAARHSNRMRLLVRRFGQLDLFAGGAEPTSS
jgi:hypothetical protein